VTAAARVALRILAGAAVVLAGSVAHAEQADQKKPTQIEADRLSADDVKRVSVFEGNVQLTKGTLSLQADRVVVRQDADGYQHATATGKPVHIRQRGDPRDGKPGVWIEGEAQRIEIDARDERIELIGDASVKRGQDEMRGDYIVVDQRSESFSVTGGKDGHTGRVQAVIQPKGAPAGQAPASGAPPPGKAGQPGTDTSPAPPAAGSAPQ